MRLALWVIALLLVVAGHARAEGFGFHSGEDLLGNCRAASEPAQTACRQYVSGSVDTVQLMQRLTMACIFTPQEDLTEQRATEIVVSYLEAHPDELWMSGSRNVIAAMAEAYPCPR